MERPFRAAWVLVGFGVAVLALFGVVMGLRIPSAPEPAAETPRACRVHTDSPVHLYNGPGADYQISLRVAVPAELTAWVRSENAWFQVIWSGQVGWLAAEDVAEVSGDCAALPLPTAAPPLLAQAPASPQSCIARPTDDVLTLYSAPDAGYPVTVMLAGSPMGIVEGHTTNGWLLLRVEDQGNIFQGYAPRSALQLENDCTGVSDVSDRAYALPDVSRSADSSATACLLTSNQPFVIFATPDDGAHVLMVISPHTLLPVVGLVDRRWVEVTLMDGSHAYAKRVGALLSGTCPE